MATEHLRHGNYKVMSEVENNCPHNLKNPLLLYISMFGIIGVFSILYLFAYAMTFNVSGTELPLSPGYAISIAIGCIVAVVICGLVRDHLPRGLGISIYIIKENEFTYRRCETYHQYTGNNTADAQWVAEQIRELGRIAEKLNEKDQTTENKRHESCEQHRDIISKVNEQLEEH